MMGDKSSVYYLILHSVPSQDFRPNCENLEVLNKSNMEKRKYMSIQNTAEMPYIKE